MSKDITQMRYYAAELRRMLDDDSIEDCECEVEACLDPAEHPAIKVSPSSLNTDPQTLFCLQDIAQFCNELGLTVYITVEEHGSIIMPVAIIH